MSDSKTEEMIALEGIPASAGVQIGKVWVSPSKSISVGKHTIEENQIEIHLTRFEEGIKRTKNQLLELKQLQKDSEVKAIIDAQVQIVNDPELHNQIKRLIQEEQKNAEYAVYSAFNDYIRLLEGNENLWFRERSVDISSIRDSIIQQITGENNRDSVPNGVIYFTDTLSPAEMMELYQANVGGVVMFTGGATAHAVIIAQSLGIPCVVAADWKGKGVEKDALAALDGETGKVVIYPDKETIKDFESRKEKFKKWKKTASRLIKKKNRTACGHSFKLMANVEFTEEIPRVNEYKAEGIGLLRTETLFLKQGYFDRENHISFYESFLKKTEKDRPVVIRLLDIGGDKLPGKDIREANPFLGWRGIRILLDEKTLLQNQLHAILDVASRHPGRVKILIPMVSDVREIEKVKEQIDLVEAELKNEGIELDEKIKIGVMVEVPALALSAKSAASVVDFFSIGSNDLTQYTMAADRGNEMVSSLYMNSHPSVWRLIKMTYDAAVEENIPIHVCGEIAGRPVLAAALIGMGIDQLSMNPASIPHVKKVLCNHTLNEFKELLDGILSSENGENADRVIETWKEKYLNQ